MMPTQDKTERNIAFYRAYLERREIEARELLRAMEQERQKKGKG